MKKTFGYLVSNKYILIVFTLLAFGLKLLLDGYHLPETYIPLVATLKSVFLVVFVTAIITILLLFVVALLTKKKSEPWWERQENDPKAVVKEKLHNLYTQSLIVSLLVILYGAIVYLAVFASWINIQVIAMVLIFFRFINQPKNTKSQAF